MTTQPEALRLADRLQDFALALPAYGFDDRPPKDAAAELRRLHAEVEALRAAQGEQEPWGYAVEGRIFVGAALPEHVQKMAAEHDFRVLKLYTSHVATSQEPQHPDDAAVDALSAAMKAKLAKQRAKGYGGWDTDCTQQRLSDMLRNHVDKGDPVDVANFCAFLLARGEGISAPVATQGEQEPVMIYHGRCTIDCGEHGHHNVEMLKLIPAGSYLYTSPVAPAAQEPVGARYRRIGRHVAEIAKRLGRPDDSAEGELEYIQRLSYSQGLEDASPVATQGELGVEIAAYALGELRIERCLQRDGSFKWAVRLRGDVLNKQGEWEFEPRHSGRDDGFIERCRFDSARAAIDAALSATTPKKD